MSHYFSRVRLLARPSREARLRDLARHGDAYRDHALMWMLFPGDGLPRDFIFRTLDDGQSYFVVSARPPQADGEWFDVQSKPYAPRLAAGDWLRFDLRANPTISRGAPGTRSRRHDVLMDAKRHLPPGVPLADAQANAAWNWLQQRAARWGLAVAEHSVQQAGYRQHRLRKGTRVIEYASLDYQGLAQVTDPASLEQALLSGVGHAKGFGCGLLLVKRQA